MSIARHHAEWLALIDISGPFLSLRALAQAFPQGLDAPDADVARELRLAYEEWLDNSLGTRPDLALHWAWVEWVLRRVLGQPAGAVRVRGDGDEEFWQRFEVTVPEHGERLRPDFAIVEPGEGGKARVLVQVVPAGQDLERAPARAAWQASPATRMMTLLRGAGVRLGLLTNGEQWMLVDRPADENLTTGFASWYARLWLDEPLTLRAFRSLLGARRLFGVPDAEMLEALLAASADDRQEVTDQLGYQVRRAVDLLVQALDLADQNEGRRLLREVPPERLYEASLTVMMRLVFLLFAEEQNLLLLGDNVYDRNYAASTLLETLREAADRVGEEVLERRYDAWGRLLAIFRAVYGGFRHDRLTMPAYGGRLFDPDRYPFLEGRAEGIGDRVSGIGGAAQEALSPTPYAHYPQISNRTVLHLLEALQVLRMRVRDGAPIETRRLSFRALDIEQIGHVYEGLLDHTALRATEPMLGLAGTRDQEPEVALSRLEELAGFGGQGSEIGNAPTSEPRTLTPEPSAKLLAFLREATGRSESALKKAFAAPLDAFRATLLRAACGNDEALYARVLPFAGLVRDDDYGRPAVIPAGSVYVTAGAERRATGTHYTPRSLTEPIVQHTLEPLVYHGPAEGLPREEWRLRPVAELLQLTVCDMAMGSGAFLVQACRYLSERILEAWAAVETSGIGYRASGIGRSREPTSTGASDNGGTVILGAGGLAALDGARQGDLLPDKELPEGGAVRPDEPDSASGSVGASEHRGGLWASASEGVPSPSLDRSGFVDGDGNTPSDRGAAQVPGARAGETSLGAGTEYGQDAPAADALAVERGIAGTANTRYPIPDTRRRLITPEGLLTTDPDEAIPADPDERLVFARRLVADRCLYGVDKNPLAAEMAKLSLWLITLAKGRPFSFLDHALRAGDSLLGIADLEQLTRWSLRVDRANPNLDWVTGPVEKALRHAFALRREIRTLPTLDARDADLKREKLAQAEQTMALVRLGADLLVAAALAPDPRSREERRGRFLSRYAMLLRAADEGRDTAALEGELRVDAEALLQGRRPFHWPLEFPEVFDQGMGDRGQGIGAEQFDVMLEDVRAGVVSPISDTLSPGFAAIMGNPPFQGGQRITGALGTSYRDYLVENLAGGRRGSADLCAYFFLRIGSSLRPAGMAGLLATNTIAQGDTREVGLDQLAAHGFAIPRAVPSRPWPGAAGVEVAHIWLRYGNWDGGYVLDEKTAAGITPFLTATSAAEGKPHRLVANEGKGFQGSIVLGMGFTLSPDVARALIARDVRNKDVIQPFLNGEDLNSHPAQSPSRYVINFFDWPVEHASLYSECFRIVEEKVRPEREKNNRKIYRDRWWQFGERRVELYNVIANMPRVLAVSLISKYTALDFIKPPMVFSQNLNVFAFARYFEFGVMPGPSHIFQ